MLNDMVKEAKNVEKNGDSQQVIVIDESMCFHVGYTCNDCPHLDWSETSNGKVWCTYFNRYENPHSSANDCPGRPAWC